MPIYEYQCADCGHEFETLQKISEDPLKECPNCNTEGLRKKVSAAGFRLKGSGWYETDFKGKKGPGGGKTEGASESTSTADKKAEGGSGDKTSKTESKSDTKSSASTSKSAD